MTLPDPACAPESGSPRARPNVILTGFMGTGKTTCAALLAERLGYELVDTDAIIEAREGPIADIFAQRGEAVFRSLEHDLAIELAERCGLVISTGGAMLVDPANAAVLGRSGSVVCLVASTDAILRRILGDAGRVDRPMLAVDDPRQRIVELLADRAAAYGAFAQVDTEDRTPEQVVDAIADLLERDHRVFG